MEIEEVERDTTLGLEGAERSPKPPEEVVLFGGSETWLRFLYSGGVGKSGPTVEGVLAKPKFPKRDMIRFIA